VSADENEPPFAIRVEGGRRIVTARGDIDMATASEFRRHVEAATEPIVVIDLTEVTYVDSAGILAVDRSLAALAERHQQVRVVVPPDSPADWTFKVAGFDPGNFFTSVDEAST
jgi:anti-sigma B factor antagonist